MSESKSPRGVAQIKFWERTGSKPYGPDFHDSLVNVMRASPKVACLTERVWAWHRWRSFCNSSETPVSDWRNGYDLDQTDTALDIWWFKQGKSVEWVIGAPREKRKQERQRKEVQHLKAHVSRAVQTLVARGDLRFHDGKYYSVMSPAAGDPACNATSAVAGSSNRYLTDKKFHEWWAVAGSSNYKTFVDARSGWNKARKVARSDYRKYLDAATAETAKTTTDSGKTELPAANVQPVDPLTLINLSKGASSAGDESVSQSVLTPESDGLTDSSRPPTRTFHGQSEREAAIEAAIPVKLCEKVHETPTPGLIARIDAKLAGAPPELLGQRLAAEWKKNGWKKITSLGLLVNFAADIGRVWLKGAVEREVDAEREAAANWRAEENRQRLADENARRDLALKTWQAMPADQQAALRREKFKLIRGEERFKRLPEAIRREEVEELIIQDLMNEQAKGVP